MARKKKPEDVKKKKGKKKQKKEKQDLTPEQFKCMRRVQVLGRYFRDSYGQEIMSLHRGGKTYLAIQKKLGLAFYSWNNSEIAASSVGFALNGYKHGIRIGPYSGLLEQEPIADRSIEDLEESEIPISQDPSPEEQCEATLLYETMHNLLQTLSYKHREVLKLRFGLGDGYTYTYDEIGQVFCVTKERARQYVNKALRKLAHPVRAKRLEGFLDEVPKPQPKEIEVEQLEVPNIPRLSLSPW